MSSIGYYRYKTTVQSIPRNIQFFVNGVLAGTKTIQPVNFCDGGRILKYLDGNGQYRFFPFSKYYEMNDSPKKIGSTNEFITNLRSDKTASKNIGYRNNRVLSLTAEVSKEELILLNDIYTSPRIYLYIGDGTTDLDKDWIEVEITGGDKTVRRRRAKTGAINLDVTLPEHYTIKMV